MTYEPDGWISPRRELDVGSADGTNHDLSAGTPDANAGARCAPVVVHGLDLVETGTARNPDSIAGGALSDKTGRVSEDSICTRLTPNFV